MFNNGTTHQHNERGDYSTTLAICITSFLGLSVVAVAMVLALVHDDAVGTRVGILVGFITLAMPQLISLARQDKVKDIAADTSEKVDRVLNGAMEAKVKKVMHQVLAERDAQWQADNGSVTDLNPIAPTVGD